VHDPENPKEIAAAVDEMLGYEEMYEACGRNGRFRVAGNFLVFEEVRRWLEVLSRVGSRQAASEEDTQVA